MSPTTSAAEEVREELAAIAPRRECDRLAELSALFHSAGRIHLRGRGEIALHLDLASPAVARRAFSLLRSFGIATEIRTYRRRAFDRATRFQLHVAGDDRALQVLHEAGVVTAALAPLEKPPRRVVARACCRGAYLRGALLGGGSLSGPTSPQLELRASTLAGAEFLATLAARDGVRLGVRDRGPDAAAYAKGADAVAAALSLAGASDAVLGLEERAVLSGVRAAANRLSNADHANLVRTSRAAHAQLQAIRRLQRSGRLEALPQALTEIAELRLRHPSLPLRELARRCHPPATKAAVHRRLQRLQRLSESQP